MTQTKRQKVSVSLIMCAPIVSGPLYLPANHPKPLTRMYLFVVQVTCQMGLIPQKSTEAKAD